MQLSIFRAAALFFSLPACAFSASNVVNLSHYDMMRPDFVTMKREGIIGVIHEATYPRLERDAKYLDRQMGALQAGLLWGAYHYADGTDPVRQADHFLSVVSNSWAQAGSATRSPGVLLVLDFEKNGHYPGGTMRADQAVSFVERIRQRTGVYPGIYSGEYHLRQMLNSPKVSNAQRNLPILKRRSAIFSAATCRTCKSSGKDAPGSRREEKLVANLTGLSRPIKARCFPARSSPAATQSLLLFECRAA